MPSIIYSTEDIAGTNIAGVLKKEHGFGDAASVSGKPCWKNGSLRLIEISERAVDSVFPDSLGEDYIIYASRHKSVSGNPTLSVHPVGNWSAAEVGGEKEQVSFAYASKNKVALRLLEKHKALFGLGAWPACMEVTHHGPLLKTPSLFIEIGSGEDQWKMENAAQLLAKVILETIDSTEAFPAVFGVGGGHYAPSFTKLQLESEQAVGHMLPKYAADAVTQETFSQGALRCKEKVELAVFDWKGLSGPQRDKLLKYANELGLETGKA